MPEVPAICDTCGTVLRSGIFMGPGSSGYFVGNKVGPCPNCGGMGSIPDGFYDFIGETLRVVSAWSPEHMVRLATDLKRARQAPDPRGATAAALKSEPELEGIARRLLIPRNPAEFWGFVAALIAILALLATLGQTDEQTIIQQVIEEQAPTVPPQERSRRPD